MLRVRAGLAGGESFFAGDRRSGFCRGDYAQRAFDEAQSAFTRMTARSFPCWTGTMTGFSKQRRGKNGWLPVKQVEILPGA